MSFLTSIVQTIASLFQSKASKAALTKAASLVTLATPIVQQIAVLTPNRTNDEIATAYQTFGVALSQAALSTPVAQRSQVLLDLATEVLAAKCPGVATNVLNTAVQLAVTAAQVAQAVQAVQA